MPLREVTIPIDYGMGVDTKTDPKLVVAGKLLRLENAVFTRGKGLVKRPGYSVLPSAIQGGGNLVSPQMLKTYNGELVCVDQNTLYAYSPSLQAWIARGPYYSVGLTEQFISKNYSTNFVDVQVVGNYAYYAWDAIGGDSTVIGFGGTEYVRTYIAAYDLATGSEVLPPTIIAQFPDGLVSANIHTSSWPKLFILAGAKVGVSYLKTDGVTNYTTLTARLITLSGSSFSIGNEITVGTTSGFTTYSPILTPYYDVVGTPTGAVFHYLSQQGALGPSNMATMDNTGAITNTTSGPSSYGPVSLFLDPYSANQVWVFGLGGGTDGSRAGHNVLFYTIYNYSSHTFPLANTHIVNAGTYDNLGAVSIRRSATNNAVDVLFEAVPTGLSAPNNTYAVTVTNAPSVGAISLAVAGAVPAGRPFQVSGQWYGLFYYINYDQRNAYTAKAAYFVNALSGNYPAAARFAYETAFRFQPGYVAGSAVYNTSTVILGAGIAIQAGTSTQLPIVGAAAVSLNFADPSANIATQSGELLILNGALVSAYDGQICRELNFNTPPSYSLNAANGGSIANGTYQYAVVYQWTDAQGNLHQSEVINNAITLAGANGTVTLTIQPCFLSNGPYRSATAPVANSYASPITVAIFRASAGTGGIFYQVNNPASPLISDPPAGAITYSDSLADSSIISSLPLYTTGGVLQNFSPPPSMVMASHNNRLWMVDCENPNDIWYTKTFEHGVGLSPVESFIVELDPKGGSIAGMSEMDSNFVVFKQSVPFLFAGDGANDTGSGSTLSTPQVLPSDAGCTSAKSLILTPKGIIRKTNNGIYLLSRSMSDEYIGMPVEQYNSQTITSASYAPTKTHIIFLTSSGLTLVYDYVANQWSTFTNHTGYSGDTFQNLYTYARTDGAIYQQNLTSYLDNATSFNVLLQTSWLTLSSVQNFQRAQLIEFLGDYGNGTSSSHGIQIQAAYDFVSAFLEAVPYSFGSASSSGPVQYREHFRRQKCDSLSLLIQEISTGASGEYLNLANMSFQAALKRGANKLSAGASVG